MRQIIFLLIINCITLASTCCAPLSATRGNSDEERISEATAIMLAKTTIKKRGLPLNQNYSIKASDSVYAMEAGPQYPIYLVEFYKGAISRPIYEVYVRKSDGYIAGTEDHTKTYKIEPQIWRPSPQ